MVKSMGDIITQNEVIDLYRISTTSLHRYVEQGKLTAYRTPGGHRRYNRQEVEQLLGHLRRKQDELMPRINEFGEIQLSLLDEDVIQS